MVELERRIFVERDIMLYEYEYTYGEKKDDLVYYTLYNVKTHKEKRLYAGTYNKVLKHARERARDGHYKNFEFLITLS